MTRKLDCLHCPFAILSNACTVPSGIIYWTCNCHHPILILKLGYCRGLLPQIFCESYPPKHITPFRNCPLWTKKRRTPCKPG